MKKTIRLVICLTVLTALFSCLKENPVKKPKPGDGPDSSTVRLLTSTTWKYYEYFQGYDTTPINLVWKIGKTNNTLNYGLNRVNFHDDGTYSEIDQNGNTINGTWSLINNGTQTKVVNYQGTFISTIKSLTSKQFQWLDQAGSNYGFMVPQDQTSDTTGGRLSLLCAHPWIYDEYFHYYSSTPTQLVYKSGNTNNTLDLHLNRAKFNTDGTYSEIDQNGATITGTWTFLNGGTQMQVNNYKGIFTSDILRLDTERFEWMDVAGSNFGEEIAQ